MPFTKRSFESIPSLATHNQTLLRQMLALFPEAIDRFQLNLNRPELDLSAVHQLLMDDFVPESLNDLLYLSSALGNPSGWRMIEHQAGRDGIALPPGHADFTYVDMAVRAAIKDWPANLSLLERAYACQRIHAKSAYKYYGPVSDFRAKYRAPSPDRMKVALETLCRHFVEQGYIVAGDQERAVRIIPYDYPNEIWFLICYADKKKRFRGCEADGEWKNFDFNPEQYDAVVYNKIFGDIRMNTTGQRVKDHQKYRYAFGTLLLDEGGAFHPKKNVVSLRPLDGSHAVDLFNVDDISGLASIEPMSLKFRSLIVPRKESCSAEPDSSLRVVSRYKPRLIPEDSSVEHAVFSYRLKNSKRCGKLELSAGNIIRYERDGDSLVLEEWLRKRGFVLSFIKDSAHARSVSQAA
jgi:hypothetical protein